MFVEDIKISAKNVIAKISHREMLFSNWILFVIAFGQFWEAEWYTWLNLVIFGKKNDNPIWSFLGSRIIFVFVFGHFWETTYDIHIRIRSFLGNRIIFVFVSGHIWFWEIELYSYLYSVIFGKPNNICIRIRSSKHYSLTSVPFWNFNFDLLQSWPENLSWYFPLVSISTFIFIRQCQLGLWSMVVTSISQQKPFTCYFRGIFSRLAYIFLLDIFWVQVLLLNNTTCEELGNYPLNVGVVWVLYFCGGAW